MTNSISRCFILWLFCNTVTQLTFYFLQLNEIIQLFRNLVVVFNLLFLGQTGEPVIRSDHRCVSLETFKALDYNSQSLDILNIMHSINIHHIYF